jgi:hypothetical protein
MSLAAEYKSLKSSLNRCEKSWGEPKGANFQKGGMCYAITGR